MTAKILGLLAVLGAAVLGAAVIGDAATGRAAALTVGPPQRPRPAVPAGGRAFALRAAGVQIYTCVSGAAGPAWRGTAPDAELRDSAGAVVGRHFAGPTWQAADSSSSVTGEPVAASPAPQEGAVPWLVLRATAHAGVGAFARVAFVTRTATRGGVAPAGGCDAARVGQTARVPYTATYTFFPTVDGGR